MNLQSVAVGKAARSTPPVDVVVQLVGNAFDVRKFAENFHVLVEVAGSGKHLKELVLQLAVSGRLSEASDETADSLILELQRERLRLAKTGVRVGEPSPPVTQDEAPYALRLGWRWIRLRDLGGFLGGGTPSKSNASFWNGPLPWVSPKDMKRPYIDDAEDHISAAAIEGSAVKLIPARSLLCVVRGMILAHSFPVAISMREVTINQDMKALVLAKPALSEFVLLSCQAARTRVLAKVERSSHGTCRLGSEALEMLPIALPPLAEQKRIVARVDQLMALIDELEAKQAKKRDLSTRFNKASLEALTTAASPEDFDTAWKRALVNFSTVVDGAEKVRVLRHYLLRLAVRGLLVAPHGGKASVDELLQRTEMKRAELVAKRKASKCDDLQSVTPVEELFRIPHHWRWTRLGVASICRDGERIPVSKDERSARRGSYDYYGASGVIDKIDDYIFDGTLLLVGEDGANLLSRSTPIAFLASGRYWVNNHAHVLDSADAETLSYLALYINAIDLAPYVTGTAQPKMNQAKMNMIPVALPPPEEQALIVAKVEYLMKLCDELEAKLRRAEERASKLVEAVVKEMVT